MPFSQAIYYPFIDITDDAWLKTSLLYWDSVRTIVPESIGDPYSSGTAQALQDAGFLLPLRVHSEMEEIEELVPVVLAHLSSPDGMALLAGGAGGLTHDIHIEKLPDSMGRLFDLHPEKLPYEIRNILKRISSPSRRGNEWLKVDEGFAMFYMTLLANQLAERVDAAVVTPSAAAERVAISARIDGQLPPIPWRHGPPFWREYEAFGRRRRLPRRLAPGMLPELTIQRVAVSPNTSVDDLLKFREAHQDELARFRTEISNLAGAVNEDLSIEALRQRVSDIYLNQVNPAIADLKEALDGRRIRWFAEGLLKLASLSAGPALVAAGVPVSTALLAGAGLSFIVLGTMYNVDKRDTLRKDPFAYLLSAQNELA
ncbi:MAG TPA: DUF6236 family protein [Pyrinomonadaceae bacterium]